jgi:galactonate dehydratase
VRITRLSTHVVGTPWRNLTYVRVHTDEGLTGVGEARMLGHTDALIGYLAEAERNHVAGSDPFDTEDLVRRMKYGDFGRAGEIVMSGIACVEMACWDIVGKALGQPVWRLLGGKVRDRIKAYANGWYTVERTPEAFHEAATKVVERGYHALKLDPFGNGHLELDRAETVRAVSLVEAVRDAIGPEADLLVEMHGRFSPATAIRLAGLLRPFDPGWIEEPYFTIQEHFNDFADAAIKKVAPGLPEVVDGYFALPTAPGLGVELDVEACAEFPRRRAKFDLYAEDWHLRDPERTGAASAP